MSETKPEYDTNGRTFSEPPREIWIPTYGTGRLAAEWQDSEVLDDDVRYIRADVAEARIAALEAELADERRDWPWTVL